MRGPYLSRLLYALSRFLHPRGRERLWKAERYGPWHVTMPRVVTSRDGGSDKRSASTATKEAGIPSIQPGTTVGTNFPLLRGDPWAGIVTHIQQLPASRPTARGSSIDVTATRGANGAPPTCAD